MSRKPTVEIVADRDADHLGSLVRKGGKLTLRELWEQEHWRSTEPLSLELMELRLNQLDLRRVQVSEGTVLFDPPGVSRESDDPPAATGMNATSPEKAGLADRPKPVTFPDSIEERDAVRMAYAGDIKKAASFLRSGLSLLVYCDKLVVHHLSQAIVEHAHLSGKARVLALPEEGAGETVSLGLRQRQLKELRGLIRALKDGEVLVIPHLDLVAGGDSSLSTESRELIELVYEQSGRRVLAFADRSLNLPEVLAARFAVRQEITGVRRTVRRPNNDELPLGEALVTASEAAWFEDFDPEELYKNVAGMNPVRIRHALQYAVSELHEKKPVAELYHSIRAFKAQTSANFEVPDITFDDIGGYAQVKAELQRALALMAGAYSLPDEKLRRELIPRGFIFWGPPGTGKTLFAKAIANKLNATIQVVSGPEVTDMYVGESERKVRELFAEARRNAPSVLVFDEFDSIASKRSGRDDGGSRAGNALVAQMLTEMDGFRPEVPMLVIGTTNRLDIIDEALLRPARFKAVGIPLPDAETRLKIAEVHSRRFRIEAEPEVLKLIAGATEGCSGDDIRSLFRDALVGLHCEEPATPADAYGLGRLVGLLRHAKQQQDAARTSQRHGPATRGGPLQPSEGMRALLAETPWSGGAARPGETDGSHERNH